MWKNAIAIVILTYLNYQNGFCQSAVSYEASSKVVGTYQVQRIVIFTDGKSIQDVDMSNPLMAKRASTTITAQRKAESIVTLRLHQYQDTTSIMTFLYGDAVLQVSATGYDLFLRDTKIGSIDGTHLTIDMESTDRQTGVVKRSVMEGKKKEQ